MVSKIELRLIGYYSSDSVKLNPELERIEEAQELAPLLRQSLSSLKDNEVVEESFIKILEGNTVFIFKTREDELLAYHTTTTKVRLSNVNYAKGVVTPISVIYKNWFIPGEKISVKPQSKPEIEIDMTALSNLKEGNWWGKDEVINGTIKYVTNYGAFVDFDGKTGLIHISNLSWNVIEHPGEVLRHGDEIQSIILDVTPDGKIQLGYKQLHKKGAFLKTGDVVVGFIKQVLANAYLVQINDSKAILPISESISKDLCVSDMVIATVSNNEWYSEKYRREISISQRSFHDEFAKVHNVGDIINLRILDTVNKDGKSSVLIKHGNLRALVPLKYLSKYYKDKISNGESINEFVPFVYVGQNEKSRLISFDMRPIERAEKGLEQQRIQEEKKAQKIAHIERRRECIESITSNLDKGAILEVIVEKITKAGVFVRITDDYSEFIAKEELSVNKVLNAEDEVFVGEPISVVYYGKENDSIILSRKDICESKYPEDLYVKSLEDLLLTMGITTNKFVGKVVKINDAYFMTDLMVVSEIGSPDNGKLLVDPITGLRIIVYVNNKLRNLVIEGRHYSVQLNLSFYDYRRKNGTPYLFSVDTPDIVEVCNPYERIVSQSFKKQTSPSSNSSLANLLDTVGQGLYSSKRRMFFELLQNADDCASKSGTQVKFELSDTHFILAHNGMPFSKQDFDSIISAAKSTKSASKKTGYKGIGFKSVFTNSTEVTIFSGGFKFTFDKSYHLYNDFREFYFFVNNYTDEPLKQQVFLEQFELECRDFHGVKDIPWQLLPIWLESRSRELDNTIFSPSSNVSIALRMDKKMLEEYHLALMEILQHPKFMLFMRNTNRIQYRDGKRYSSVKKIVDNNANVTLLNNVIEDNPKETFHIENSGSILVNNDAFASAQIPIKRVSKTNSAGLEETVLVHIDEQGKIQSEINIPNRLASADSIEISFAIKTDEGGIIHPLDLTSKSGNSCFYSYLPMNEQRFKLPLYVNADFDLHSDREGVKADSPWNEFLFYHIGRQLVHVVYNVGSASQKNYLNLLLVNLFDVTNPETEKLSRAFNRGYEERLHDIPFVINDIGNKVTTQGLIIDKSGITDDVSSELFYILYNNGKRQPLGSIDVSILSNAVFDIQQVDVDTIIQAMAENLAIVQEWIISANPDELNALLVWLQKNNVDEDFVKQLCIVSAKEGLVSIEQLQSSNNYVFLKSNDLYIETTLNAIGLKTLIIDDDNVLNLYLQQSDQKVFEIISQKLSALADNILNITNDGQIKGSDYPISINNKLLLVKYLNGLSKIGDKSIGGLPLFNNAKLIPTPLASMVPYRESAPSFLADYMISAEENIADIQKYLIPSNDEFDRVIWKNRTVLGLTPSELLSHNTTDSEAYLITLIDEAQSNADLNNLIDNVYEASEKVKIKFIDRINTFTLNDDIVYEEDSFESKAINLAISVLTEPSDFAKKIIYRGKTFSEYSIDEDIICKYSNGDSEKSVKIPLVKLLPAYANNTIGIHDLRRLFKVYSGFDKLLKTHPKSLNEVFVEVNKLLSLPDREFPIWPNSRGNGIQYLFICFYRRYKKGWNNRYIPDINLGEQSNEFIFEILDFLCKNNIAISSSPFTYHLNNFFKGLYFNDVMISKTETIIPAIEEWANSDEKRHKYLRENGVKDGNAKEIKFRRMLNENQRIDYIEDLTASDINNGISFVCSNLDLTFPLVGDNQVETLKILSEKAGVNIKKNINLMELSSLSREWDSPEYTSWIQNHYPHIFFYDGNMPYFLDYGNIHICQIASDKDYHYEPSTKKLYINSEVELTPLLFSLVTQQDIPFDTNDYRILCMEGKVSISKDVIAAKNEEIESLKSRVEELERLLNGRNVHIGRTSSGLSKNDQYASLIEAQQALILKRPDWSFPIGFGERNDDGTPSCFTVDTVQNEEGNNMEIVLKSYKKTDEPFHINPEEWEAVVKRRAKLFVYTYFKDELDIVEIPKDELIRKQSSIQISFDTSNLDEEKYPNKISEFASILRYFQQITFDFNQFHISKDAVNVKDISSKRDLTITSAEDEDI